MEKAHGQNKMKPSKNDIHLHEINTDKQNRDSEEVSITQNAEIKVYRRRWYIIFVYCLVTFSQAAIWNTWGPIAASSEKAFGWSDSTLALLPNWGPISFIPLALPFSWLVDVKGLRFACVIAAALTAVATAIRCITSEPPYVTWTVNIAQCLNGMGGPVAKGVAPVLSAVWFPPNQRTTATAICAVSNYLGVAVSFLIGPYMVPEKTKNEDRSKNQSYIITSPISSSTNHSLVNVKDDEDYPEINRIRSDIMIMNYVECGFCVFVLALILIYFPAKPKHPPSMTASTERLDFKSGFKGLVKNKMFWMTCVTYGVSLGVLGLWQGILDVVLKPHGVTEQQAGWIGFYSLVAGNGAALVVAKFADVFSKHMKVFLISLYLAATACFLWFDLIITDVFESSTTQIYLSIILGTLFLNAAPPLFFELVCESTYPISEGITNFALTAVFNIAGLIFLLIQLIPNIGTLWANWFLLGSIALSIPVLYAMDDSYNRLSVDEKTQSKDFDSDTKQQ